MHTSHCSTWPFVREKVLAPRTNSVRWRALGLFAVLQVHGLFTMVKQEFSALCCHTCLLDANLLEEQQHAGVCSMTCCIDGAADIVVYLYLRLCE